MECHYKILNVELNANDEAIKKAYRKAALKYHPDKNPDSLEEATERFRLVQAAYDVLSDPQERAWYDRHREEILHRKQYENYKENSIDLFEYFAPSVYKGFGDDERGFYAVYQDVFIKINSEDEPFRSDDLCDENMPKFGYSKSDYDEIVHNFYASWQAYSTSMSFVWVNQHDVKEAPNRRVARIIEKENKKERDKHKKKRNELVRELVAFVRKRDPRVKAHKLELEKIASEQARKAEERRASAIRERVEEAALYDETNKEEIMKHHERVAKLEGMMKDEFGFTSSEEEQSQDEEEDEYKDELFCIACNKQFKSEMGLRNHKKSKKHRENINRLQQEMRNDVENEEDVNDEEDPLIKDNENFEDLEYDIGNKKLSKKQKKQRKHQQKLLNNMMTSQPFEVKDFEWEANENISNGTSTPEMPIEENESSSVTEVETINNGELDKCEIDQKAKNGNDLDSSDKDNFQATENSDSASNQSNANKKNEKQRQSQTSNNNKDPSSNSEVLGCGKCSKVFPSRNKLFQHLKQTGHSLPLEDGSKSSKRNKKKR